MNSGRDNNRPAATTRHINPDRAALEIAHRALATTMTLDDMLKDRCYTLILNLLARRHMKNRSRFDPKMAAANDEI